MDDHYDHLAQVVLDNLENQHDWTRLQLHKGPSWPRILISGLPTKRMYIHPDEQIDIIKAERTLGNGERLPQPPEFEWVLPVHLVEKPTVERFAGVFDSIDALPPGAEMEESRGDEDGAGWKQWRTTKRQKRILLAIVHDDSTIAYYFLHDGLVKPRQN